MTLDEIRKLTNYICVKENSGNTLKPDQLNFILPACNINMFNRKIKQAEELALTKKNLPNYNSAFLEALLSMVELREFHANEDITFTTGAFDITTLTYTYAYWEAMTTIYRGASRGIDLISDTELRNRKTNMLAPQLEDFPAAQINGSIIKVFPSDIATANFSYLKIPATPVYDYYLDANQNIVYLAVNATHVLTTGEIGSSGETAGQTVTSKTVELEWNTVFHAEFANELLEKVGINLKDDRIRAYSKEMENK